MSEIQPEEIEVPSAEPKISKDAESDIVAARIREAMEQAESRAFSKFVDVLSATVKAPAAEKVERNLPAPEVKRDERLTGFGDVTDGREYLYRRLPKDLQAIRNPRIDGEMARWIRAASRVVPNADVMVEWERRDAETIKRADLLEGSTTAGSGLSAGTAGPLIPLPLHNQIVLLRDRSAVLRRYARVVTSPALTLRVPVMGVATAAMAAEGAVASQGEPTNTSILLSKKKMQFVAQASEESLMDSAFNVVSLFTERAASAFGQYEDVQICTSDGSAPDISGSLETPNNHWTSSGAAAQTITAYSEAVSGTLGYDDVLGIFFALPKQYRNSPSCIWMGDATMMRILSQIVDANGRPIFAPASNAASPMGDSVPAAVGTIFGKDVVEVPLTSTNLFFGDMAYYYILEGERMSLKSTDAVSWTADTIDFKITARWDGAIASTTPFRTCAGITTAG